MSDSPASSHGVFIDRETNTFRVLKPNPEIERVGDQNTLRCYDTAGNKIEVVGIGCDPVYQTDFKRGPLGMSIQQTVGRFEHMSINLKDVDKSGVVYCENTL